MTRSRHSEHPGAGLLTDDDWQHVENFFELSFREREVAELLFQGLNRETIALRLRKDDDTPLSPETVRVYCDRLFRKLNVLDVSGMTIRILSSLDWFRKAAPSMGIHRK